MDCLSFWAFVKKRPNGLQVCCHSVAVAKNPLAKTAHSCHFERSALAQSEKSTEFKTHFKFKAKNSRFKSANSHFKFMDTSLTLSMTMQNKYSITLGMTKGEINQQDKSV